MSWLEGGLGHQRCRLRLARVDAPTVTLLKATGFQRNGRTLFRVTADAADVLQFQASQWNTVDSLSFTAKADEPEVVAISEARLLDIGARLIDLGKERNAAPCHPGIPLMLQPNQFQVNETWIAFKLTDQPLHTERDGDFDFVALMDAASCFILGTIPVSTSLGGPTAEDCRQLLEAGRAHKDQLPTNLFISGEVPAAALAAEALSQGIDVVEVEPIRLLPFTEEAKEAFREHFGGVGPP